MSRKSILHFGKNVANNPYANVKYLLSIGESSHDHNVLSYDNTHGMAKPEWDELKDTPFPKDIFDEKWIEKKGKEQGFKRPEWFFEKKTLQYSARTGKKLAFPIRYKIDCLKTNYINKLVSLGVTRHKAYRRLPQKLGGKLKVLMNLPIGCSLYFLSKVIERLEAIYIFRFLMTKEEQNHIAKIVSDVGLHLNKFDEYIVKYGRIRHWLRDYDLVQTYSTDAIYALLAMPHKPYIVYDTGSLRDINKYSLQSKLMALAYKKAKHLFITNPDTVEYATKRGITYSYIPHIVDYNRYKPLNKERSTNSFIILAPARQNWDIKGNNILLEAFAKFAEGKDGVVLKLAEWGQHIEITKELIASLKLQKKIEFYQPSLKNEFIRNLNDCDVVADQFVLTTFGGIVPEAMSCEKPVITGYKKATHEWCFTENPPILPANSVEEIHEHLQLLYSDKSKRASIGKLGRDWVKTYYSPEVVVELHNALYENIF